MTFELVLVGSYFLLLLLSLGLATYNIYTKLDSLESYFKDNAMIMGCRRWWGGKNHGDRWIRLGIIGSVLMFPRIFIWRGMVTQQEIDAIPLALRRWTKATFCVDISLLFGVIVFWISQLFR